MRYVIVAVALLAGQGPARSEYASIQAASSVVGVFVGSTPCDAPIRRLLRIPADAEAELIEWRLVLHERPHAGADSEYQLQFRYGLTVPNTPGLGSKIVTVERNGVWRHIVDRANPPNAWYELDERIVLRRISATVLHVQDDDYTLMSGNGGWSYTLSREDRAEPLVDQRQAPPDSGEPRTLSPVSTGPTVFGIFEGRTPCQGIARELLMTVGAGCAKAKWRVTLYQHSATREPTTYKIESTLHRTAREGSWRIDRGSAATRKRRSTLSCLRWASGRWFC